jgi:DNA-binding transcriptional LysR family regulator
VRLLHRSTHGLSLTDEGDTFLQYCRRLMDTAAELGSELSGKASGPSGWVRISVSPVIAQMVIAPSLPGLYDKHPQIHVDINADDRVSDMARDGIDIAIRTGSPSGETLVARQIGEFGRTLCASPAYIQRFGSPRTVADLSRHRLIANSSSPVVNRWPLAAGGDYAVQGHTRTDNSAMVLTLVLQGVGLARLMDPLAWPLLRSGQLVPLLQDELARQQVPIYAVMLNERHRLPKIRACIDHWQQWLVETGQPPKPAHR